MIIADSFIRPSPPLMCCQLSRRSAYYRLGWLLIYLIAIGVAYPQTASAQPTDPRAAFDWSVPDRFGLDADEDGLIDYFTTADAISPQEWRVNLDACASIAPEGSITLYRWEISNLPGLETGECATSINLPQEGTYQVTLTVITDQGSQVSVSQEVEVDDILILSLGDSFASGEGVPDIAGSLPFQNPTWQNADYHRSALAAPAVAARLLEESSAKTSVTFVHLARTGARIVADDPTDTAVLLSTQIAEAQGLVGQRQIDALVVSIGANDVGFSKLIQACVVQEDCDSDTFSVNPAGLAGMLCQAVIDVLGDLFGLRAACETAAAGPAAELNAFTENQTRSAASLYAERAALLPSRYDEMAQQLFGLNIAEGGIYITEYPRPTRDDAGELCEESDTETNDLPGLNRAEFRWFDEDTVTPLNTMIAEAAQRHGWGYIDGIDEGFTNHGYCATENWIMRIDQSVTTQLDPIGTMHPNITGHEFVAEQIVAPLRSSSINLNFKVYLPLQRQ